MRVFGDAVSMLIKTKEFSDIVTSRLAKAQTAEQS